MKTTTQAQRSAQLELLEAQLMAGRLDRRRFIRLAGALGTTGLAAITMADKALAIGANQAELRRELKPRYDYIVCGAGSSGSVVARRLAEDPGVQVLLLEAGGAADAPSILNPAVWYTNIGGPFDWGFKTMPRPGLNNRSIAMPMGKAIGGGSSINATVWARGHKHDYDHWARASGDEAWGYRHVLEIYKRIEDWQGEPDPARRGKGGLVFMQPAPDPSPLAPAMVQACASVGIPAFADHNGAMMEGPGGAAIANLCVKDGQRRNVPSHYLYPIMDQANLTILTQALVHKLTLDGKKVTGVEVEWDGQVRKIGAAREVVLSAGAINTPRILMLSGIGDATELKRLGVPVVANLPGVGRNFQDHTMVAACMWEPPEGLPPRNNSAEATFFWKSDPKLATPDMQPFQIEIPFSSELTSKRAVPTAWTIGPGIVRPESRGHLRLKSSNPRDEVEIHAKVLEHPQDMAAMRKAVELCREIGNAPPMKAYVKREVMPGPIKGKELDNFIRDAAVSYFHATCTAKMGTDKMSVVDARLRVYGIENLRIADGSIMPRITTGNTMAPCVIIGERLGEILRAG
ncbi:GMC family oxidoreductase N-terminal domain-containing protein [Variovorax saccharolyticus]|uniref:GMC family oxidoreductase N-terminal domain-containing protein n=1 Tax=Variovorax saccharolyticus TaxID=3053516 RepID=UPI002575ED61|nr:GMC family oxidoreductase N-terminal domain-containing protein [Variovorax sp. J22R187]MDM0019095.1 GMC family oxidoreductase N-terminal domain-containing protein [Variovorax sp. J22R187]